MTCDCGEGCCPSSNPLYIHEIAWDDVTTETFMIVKMNEIIDKHNILLANKELEDTTKTLSNILLRLEELEEK